MFFFDEQSSFEALLKHCTALIMTAKLGSASIANHESVSEEIIFSRRCCSMIRVGWSEKASTHQETFLRSLTLTSVNNTRNWSRGQPWVLLLTPPINNVVADLILVTAPIPCLVPMTFHSPLDHKSECLNVEFSLL